MCPSSEIYHYITLELVVDTGGGSTTGLGLDIDSSETRGENKTSAARPNRRISACARERKVA